MDCLTNTSHGTTLFWVWVLTVNRLDLSVWYQSKLIYISSAHSYEWLMVILYNNLHLCLKNCILTYPNQSIFIGTPYKSWILFPTFGLSIELVWTWNQNIWEVDLDFSGFLKIIILYILNINTTREVAEGVVQLASWTIS